MAKALDHGYALLQFAKRKELSWVNPMLHLLK